MKLLVVTQAVDGEDPVLGFFVGWLAAFAKHAEQIEVICLKEGKHNLPPNVRVHSLGKERDVASRLTYSWRFLSLAWRLQREYDAVFVHMNQEYILLAGWLWKLLGKRIYLWRNHYAGSLLTDIAAAFCITVFCTSKYSYTAKYKKTILMPVGVDDKHFAVSAGSRQPNTILFLSRISPSKRPDILIDAVDVLSRKGIDIHANFYGAPLPEHEKFYNSMVARIALLRLQTLITLHPALPNAQTPNLYRMHEIFVNTSPSGMFDKTIFEAAASGSIVLASSEDFKTMAGDELYFKNANELAVKLETLRTASDEHKRMLRDRLQAIAQDNSLNALMPRLVRAMEP